MLASDFYSVTYNILGTILKMSGLQNIVGFYQNASAYSEFKIKPE